MSEEVENSKEKEIQEFSEKIASFPSGSPIILRYYYYYQRGCTYYELKFYDESKKDFSKVINEIDPEGECCYHGSIYITPKWLNAGCYYQRGRVYYELQEDLEAINNFTRSLEIDSSDNCAFYNRGAAYHNLKKYEKAIEDLTLAIKHDPKDIDAMYIRGLGYYYTKEYEKAVNDFNVILKMDKNFSDALYNRGLAYIKLKKYKKANNDFTLSIKMGQVDEEISSFYKRAKVYILEKKYKKAIEDYNTVLGVEKDNFKALARRGYCYKLLKKYDEAAKDFEMAFQTSTSVGGDFSDNIIEMKRGKDLKVEAELMKNRSIVDDINKESKAWLKSNSKKKDDLSEKLKKIMKFLSNFQLHSEKGSLLVENLVQRSKCFYSCKNYEEAIKSNTLIIDKLDDLNDLAYYYRGLAFHNLKDYEKSISDFSKTISINELRVEAYYGKGLSFSRLKKREEARKAFEKAIEINPNYAGSYFGLGELFVFMSIDNYSKSVEKNPEDRQFTSNIFRERGYCYKLVGMTELALEDFKKASELNPELSVELNDEISSCQKIMGKEILRDLEERRKLKEKEEKIYEQKVEIKKLKTEVSGLKEKDEKMKQLEKVIIQQECLIRQYKEEITELTEKERVVNEKEKNLTNISNCEKTVNAQSTSLQNQNRLINNLRKGVDNKDIVIKEMTNGLTQIQGFINRLLSMRGGYRKNKPPQQKVVKTKGGVEVRIPKEQVEKVVNQKKVLREQPKIDLNSSRVSLDILSLLTEAEELDVKEEIDQTSVKNRMIRVDPRKKVKLYGKPMIPVKVSRPVGSGKRRKRPDSKRYRPLLQGKK